jgi:SAM-dependent methyltransferase
MIARFENELDGDLMLCPDAGVAYQADMRRKIRYGEAYLACFDEYARGQIAARLMAGRVAMLSRHVAPDATVLDVGCGSGAFIQAAIGAGFKARGYDVIPEAVSRLISRDLYDDEPCGFEAVTFWDSIEHIEEPEIWLRRVNPGAVVLAAIPVFEDLRKVRESKHYKPGEHLYYWTPRGFVEWMGLYGFRLLEMSSHEVDAGRESIGAFAFCRDFSHGGALLHG